MRDATACSAKASVIESVLAHPFSFREDRNRAVDSHPERADDIDAGDRLPFGIDDRAVDRLFIARDRREREAETQERGRHRRFLGSCGRMEFKVLLGILYRCSSVLANATEIGPQGQDSG